MNVNNFQALISLALCALMAFGFYSFPENTNKLILGLGSFIMLSVTLILTIAVSFDQKSKTLAFRTTSGVFFSTLFISNFVFSFYDFDPAVYLVVNGIQFLTFLSIAYSISKREDTNGEEESRF